MKKLMTSLFLAMATLLCMNPIVSGNNVSTPPKETKKIILKKAFKVIRVNRDMFADISASYCPEMNVIELVCDGTKETSVYIVNSAGEEISYYTFDSSMTTYFMVDVPQTSGTYWLVIDSPVLYAEGAFTVE